MEMNEIKTPEDVFLWLEEHMKYGWVDVNKTLHGNEMKEFRKLYRTMSVEESLRRGIGTCIEQAAVAHELLNRIRVRNRLFCCRIFEPDDYGELESEEHMHCFVLFFREGKVYYLEHAHSQKKGIHEFASEQEALSAIIAHHIELRGGKESPTARFYELPAGYSFREFNAYINKREQEKDYQAEVCRAKKKDMPRLLAFYHSLIGLPGCAWSNDYPDETTLERDLENDSLFFIEDEKGIVATISIDDDKEVEKLACWTIHNSKELSRLGVRPDMQNRGVARFLLTYLMKKLAIQGYEGVHFLVSRNNPAALASYAKLDFTNLGEADLFDIGWFCYEKRIMPE